MKKVDIVKLAGDKKMAIFLRAVVVDAKSKENYYDVDNKFIKKVMKIAYKQAKKGYNQITISFPWGSTPSYILKVLEAEGFEIQTYIAWDHVTISW